MVGWSNIDPFYGRAFRYSGGVLLNLGNLVTVSPRSSDGSAAAAINASGLIVGGTSADAVGIEPPQYGFVNGYGFIYTDHMTRILLPGCHPEGSLTGINDAGDYVGAHTCLEYDEVTGLHYAVWHAWIHTSDGDTDMSDACQFLGPASVQPVAVNANRQAAIWAQVGGDQTGFLWTGGIAVNVGLVPRGMNDAGDVVGWGGGPSHAFLYHAGATIDLGTLSSPGAYSDAYDINNHGQIVGSSDGGTRAFIYENGVMRDLNQMIDRASGFTLRFATGINEGGQICGDGRNAAGQYNAFLLTPCRLDITALPAPATVCPSVAATFTVAASGGGTVAYRWQWQPEAGAAWTNLADGVNAYQGQPALDVTGATEPTLSARVLWGLGGNLPFRCVVTNSCGSVTSDPASLTICIGEFNCDGGIDGGDVGAFFGEWEAGNAIADVNADGGIDGADVSSFFEHWEAGC
ncbi:MAG: hypothetical protein JSR77_03665 [Planctomycetes bacterium]|nr:hypothetical protein [Planctomycetota bacterium]